MKSLSFKAKKYRPVPREHGFIEDKIRHHLFKEWGLKKDDVDINQLTFMLYQKDYTGAKSLLQEIFGAEIDSVIEEFKKYRAEFEEKRVKKVILKNGEWIWNIVHSVFSPSSFQELINVRRITSLIQGRIKALNKKADGILEYKITEVFPQDKKVISEIKEELDRVSIYDKDKRRTIFQKVLKALVAFDQEEQSPPEEDEIHFDPQSLARVLGVSEENSTFLDELWLFIYSDIASVDMTYYFDVKEIETYLRLSGVKTNKPIDKAANDLAVYLYGRGKRKLIFDWGSPEPAKLSYPIDHYFIEYLVNPMGFAEAHRDSKHVYERSHEMRLAYDSLEKAIAAAIINQRHLGDRSRQIFKERVSKLGLGGIAEAAIHAVVKPAGFDAIHHSKQYPFLSQLEEAIKGMPNDRAYGISVGLTMNWQDSDILSKNDIDFLSKHILSRLDGVSVHDSFKSWINFLLLKYVVEETSFSLDECMKYAERTGEYLFKTIKNLHKKKQLKRMDAIKSQLALFILETGIPKGITEETKDIIKTYQVLLKDNLDDEEFFKDPVTKELEEAIFGSLEEDESYEVLEAIKNFSSPSTKEKKVTNKNQNKTPILPIGIETPLGTIKEENLQYDKTIAWVTSKITQLQSLGKDIRKNVVFVVSSLVDSYFREEHERKRIVQYIRAFGLEDRRKDILTTLGILLKKHDKAYDRYSRYDTVFLQTTLFALFLHIKLKFKVEAANKTAIDIFSLNKNYSESVREGAKASGIEVIDTDSVRLLFEQIKLSFIDRKLTEKQIVIPRGGKIPAVAIDWTDLGGGMAIGTPKYIIEGENEQGRFKVFPRANDESSLSFILSHGGKHFPISKKEGDRLLEQSKKAQEKPKPKPDPENTLTIKNNGAIPASAIKWVKLAENLFMGTPKVPIRLDKNTLVLPPSKSTNASTKVAILAYLNILFPLTQTERNRILNWDKKREAVSKPAFKESEKADSFLPLPPPVKKWMEVKIEAFRKKEADGKITTTDFIIEDVVRDRKKGTLIFRVHHPKKVLFPKANIYISSEGKIQSTSTQGLQRGSYQVLISKATFKRLYSTLQNSEVCTLATLAIFGKERGNEFDKLADGVSPGMYLQKCGNLYARKEKRSQLHKKAKEIYEKAKAEGFAYGKVLAYTSKQFLQYGENGLNKANLKGLKAWAK